MGAWAEYEEKEFETLANAEFVLNSRAGKRGIRLFSPGQVLEKTLGFDFSTKVAPHSPLHRRLFAGFPSATGITSPTASAVNIPVSKTTRLLNFFVQYKRPEHFAQGHRSSLWSKNEEYLRFRVADRRPGAGMGWDYSQIAALVELQDALSGSALVRYACPSVWTKNALYSGFHGGDLLDSSVFVDPGELETIGTPGTFHKYWTFQSTNLSSGMPNPGGPKARSVGGERFFNEIRDLQTPPNGSEAYLTSLLGSPDEIENHADSLRDRRARRSPSDRSIEERERGAIEDELESFGIRERGVLKSAIEMSSVTRELDLQWMVFLLDEPTDNQ